MQLLGRLNRRLEALFEGLFRESQLDPTELARQLGREMLEAKPKREGGQGVPNHFTLLLHPEDVGALGAFREALAAELAQHLRALAKEQGVVLGGPVTVEVEASPEVGRGRARVCSEVRNVDEAELARLNAAASADLAVGDTRVYKPRREEVKILHLLVVDGPDTGRRLRVGSGVEIGRQPDDQQGALRDPNVSRRHARFEHRDQGWFIVDLESTNGTLVNDDAITEHALRAGDRVKLGSTTLLVEDAP